MGTEGIKGREIEVKAVVGVYKRSLGEPVQIYLESKEQRGYKLAKIFQEFRLPATELDCGVKCLDAQDVYKPLFSKKGFFARKKNYILTLSPPKTPFLVTGVNSFSISSENYSPYITPHIKSDGETFNVFYCHGKDGKATRNPPVDDWMLYPDVPEKYRNTPILEFVKQTLESGVSIDAMITCNAGGYPKNPLSYPFLEDIVYPQTAIAGEVTICRDKTSSGFISGYNVRVPERFKDFAAKAALAKCPGRKMKTSL